MTDTWRPLSVRESDKAGDYDGPFEGVPNWLYAPLWSWILDRFALDRFSESLSNHKLDGLFVALHMDTRSLARQGAGGKLGHLETLVTNQPDRMLDVADWCLLHMNQSDDSDISVANSLGSMLLAAGSVWEVRQGKDLYLARRVSNEEESLARTAAGQGTTAADHIAASWRALYGRNPNAGDGYREAVKAVEAVTISVVIPKDPSATLGKVNTALRDGADKFEVRLDGQGQVARVLAMMELLWKGQVDRHGEPQEIKSVTVEQAQDALRLAVTLVGWFESGAVHQK